MFKIKNIFIIFILNYLILLLVCGVIELISISNTAEQVQIMMRTAADMALEQVQATDDFFTTGGGYILSSNPDGSSNHVAVDKAYQATVLGSNGRYKKVNIFEALVNKSGINAINDIYDYVYKPSKIASFIDNNPAVLSVDFTAGVFSGGEFPTLITYKVPTLAQMGNDKTSGRTYKVYNSDGSPMSDNNIKDDIFEMYDLKKGQKEANINGQPINYYLTPLSLGVTYMDENLLQAFFMNNLELLMRGKYVQNNDYNLRSEKYGNGVLKTSFYPELVDTTSLNVYNPINNGDFTLLRGKKMGGTASDVEFYEGIKPKVEYLVVDMYDDKYNDILQLILGPKTTSGKDSIVSSQFKNKEITGSLLRDMNYDSIVAMETVMNPKNLNTYKHKAIVVAKVSFYADFIIPYKSVSLREMRGREINSRVGGRSLFNPFQYSTLNIDSIEPISENYVDLEHKTKTTDTRIYDTVQGFTDNSDALVYTAYFAVTP